jgi:ribokinase
MPTPASGASGAVVVVGSLHYDIMVDAPHRPRKGETVAGSAWRPKFGGKGGNQAVAAARAGARTRMAGAVGDDGFGSFLLAGLDAANVDRTAVAVIGGAGSGMSVAIADAEGDYGAVIVSGANLRIPVALVEDGALWRDARILVLQNEVDGATNLAAARAARRAGALVCLNAAPARPLEGELGGLVDILVVNAVEAEMMGAAPIATLPDAAEAARNLANRFEAVIVTAGALGLAAWSAEDEHFSIAAEKITVVSSHGAGDAFIGALAASIVQGSTFKAACEAASHAAAEHVAGRSAR